MFGALDWILTSFVLVIAAAISLWMTGAIYFDVFGARRWGVLPSIAWTAGMAILMSVWHPLWQPCAALCTLFVIFFAWWLRLKPSHDREWDPAVALLPRALRDGDAFEIENVRNFDYRSLADYTPRYETRTVHLSRLRSADVIFFNWGSPWMSHPVMVFDFGDDGRLCISIEVRYRKGQNYSVLRSLYRQQELIFLVADERDVILRRTKYGTPQTAHLYRLPATPAQLRTAFLDYIATINALYEAPRWYHAICANCTTSYYRMPSRHWRFDWRLLANARLDQSLYEAGQLDSSLPFPELQRLAYLNEIANSAPEAGFGDYIRSELEKRRHER